MDYELHVQDPTSGDPEYLFEAIIGAVERAARWRGMFAFASSGGIDALLEDPIVEAFLQRRAVVDLLVGLDAITNRPTLERLQELGRRYPSLTSRVFWNHSGGLFHPKISHFDYPDGGQVLIVGSGNLTPGGLRENIEAFSVLRCGPRERLDLRSWDGFLERHAQDLRAIDLAALDRAARNIVRGGRRRQRQLDVEPDVELAVAPAARGAEPVPAEARFLVARVPKAGGRWHQVHFNRDVVERFFRVRPDSTQRVYLTALDAAGARAPQEVRPCIYSHVNKNCKIELRARHDAEYPEEGAPVAVFRELQPRTFEYMLLLPGDPGFSQMVRLTEDLPSLGRGAKRVVTDAATVRTRWRTCPLLE